MLVGLGMLVVGLVGLALLFMASRLTENREAAIVFGTLALVAVIFMCVRSGVLVDRQRCTITAWWGLLLPIYVSGTSRSFSRTQDVILSLDLHYGSRGSKNPFYPVLLGGADAIVIHAPGNYEKARRLAEELAKFLDVGIRDRSEGDEVVREAGTLDLSLRERLQRAGQSVPLPVQPSGARAILSYGASRSPATIEIPPISVGACARMFLIGILAAGVVAMLLEFGAWYSGMPFGFAAQCVLLPALCIVPPLIIRNAILRERLAVSPDEIVVTRRDVFGTRTTRLKGSEVEEVVLLQKRGAWDLRDDKGRVVIRSDRRSIKLIAELSNPQEVKWLRDALVHFLTATTLK